MKNLRNMSLLAIAASGLVVSHANAQSDFYSRDKYESVTERAQPDFDPEPVRLGSFLVQSDLTVGASTTDNVLAASGNPFVDGLGATIQDPEESDTILSAAIGADARTDWSVHQIGLRGRLEQNEYSDFSEESYTQIDVGAGGRLDVSRDLSLNADVGYFDSVQPRANYANGAELDAPIEFNRTTFTVGANYQNDRIQWNNSLRVTDSDFDNGVNRITGDPFNQDFRDNQNTNLTTRLSYAISPNVAVFGQGSASQAEYDSDQSFTDTDPTSAGFGTVTTRTRDSDGYTVAAGVNFETTNLLRGDIAVGFFSEDKKDEAFEDVDGLSVDGSVEWFPSRLTTVEFVAGRRVTDNGLIESPSTLQTNFGATVDHEFSRQVVGSLFGDFTEDDYQEVDRTDDYRRLGAALTYKLNKRVHLTGSVRNIERDVNQLANQFDQSFSANEIGFKLSFFP